VVYELHGQRRTQLFNPLIEAAMKGLKELKDKYSFEEAWWRFGNFLYVSYILLSSEHPTDDSLSSGGQDLRGFRLLRLRLAQKVLESPCGKDFWLEPPR
jgi:hypothetical protein